jgi:tetratricopeptide (TPR) repeat protein/anti-sigma regulatory factor (Ser/Thr protein kinase)
MLKAVLLIVFLNGCHSALQAQVSTESCLEVISSGNNALWHFKPQEALKKYNSAKWMASALGSDSLYALAQFGAGQAIWYLGDFTKAIDTVKTALPLFQKSGDYYNTTAALRILSNIYDDIGDYENAFKTVIQALEIFKGYHDDQNEMLSLIQLGTLYKNIGDTVTAMSYYQKVINAEPTKGNYSYRELYHRIGELYVAKNELDSSRYYYEKAFAGNRNSKTIRTRIGETYLLQNRLEEAFRYFSPLLAEAKSTEDVNIEILASLGMAKIYLLRNDIFAATRLADTALILSTQRGQRQNRRDAYKLLSAIYEAKGDPGTALNYQKQFQQIKDSLITDQFKGQLYSFRYKTEQSEQLAEIQAEKNAAVRRLILSGLAAVLIFVFVMLRHKNEKLKLSQRASDLEMQALRAQMNPHFVFNCLTAINHFVLANETDKASQYLTRFSRLLRMVLINAGKAVITLEEEIAVLELYLDMEKLRFKDAFDYTITCDETVQPSMVNLPSFILQPFCENAIWHGLLHKEGKGRLDIHCSMHDKLLRCTITDNGIGREKAASLKTISVKEHISLGQALSAERLGLYNGKKTDIASFTIQDLKDHGGTRVVLMIKQPV